MYDENAYKQTYAEVNALQCVFERGMLRRCLGCDHGIRRNIAEREAVGCRDKTAQQLCGAFKQQLKQASAFVLKLTHPDDPLPHAKELKLQCGGLKGLQQLAAGAPAETVENVYGLLAGSIKRYGSIEELPYQEMIVSIREYEARPRR